MLLHTTLSLRQALTQIAANLDQAERDVMAEAGVESEAYLRYAAEDSGNADMTGMFSSQVRRV